MGCQEMSDAVGLPEVSVTCASAELVPAALRALKAF